MSLGIYKQGQGYWVRVMTAVLLAVATLGAAGWVANQVSVFETRLPRNSWRLTLDNVSGTVNPGDRVELIGKAEVSGAPAPILGTAEVVSYAPAQEELILRRVEMSVAGTGPDSSVRVAHPARSFAADYRVRPAGIPLIEPKLLIGISVGVVLLLGSMLAYYFVGVRRGSVEFLINTDMEMKKVNWSTPREVRGSTIVVICACFIIATFLFGIDLMFQWFFRVIGILVDVQSTTV
ncbi:MAG: preprotein translocase subunit SecE [Phycisphaeraceae bacterium]|nr:preprotein translocase subunit SecE [Phycisphaeraceae bacterium]